MARATQRKGGPVTTRFQHTTDTHASRSNGPSAKAPTKRGVRTFAPATTERYGDSPSGRSTPAQKVQRNVRTVSNTVTL